MVECQICSERKQKHQLFLTKSGGKSFWQKLSQHASKSIGCSSFILETELFKAYCVYVVYHFFDEEKSQLLTEESEIGFLIANNSSKNHVVAEKND